MTDPARPTNHGDDKNIRPSPGSRPSGQPSPDPLVEFDRAARQALAGASDLAKSLGLESAAQTALDAVRTAADVARFAGEAATRALPPDVRQALLDLDRAVRAVERDAIGPTVGAARLVAESLDSLGALIAEPIAALPEPLASLVAMAARLAREPVTVELALPPALRHARLAASVVRDLVEHAAAADTGADLDRIERAIEEAVVGAVLRNQALAPLAEVRVRATLRHDLLTVDVADGVADRDAAWAYLGARDDGWDIGLVRSAMDVVAFTATDRGGVLRLERRLRLR